MKISVNSIKKEVREKELAQEKFKKEQEKPSKLLEEVLSLCLAAAIDGNNYLDIGYKYPELSDISVLLEYKFIECNEISGEEYALRKIKGTLDALNEKKHGPMDKILHSRASRLAFCLYELWTYMDCSSVYELVKYALDDKNSVEETIVYLFKANTAYKEMDFGFDDDLPQEDIDNIESANNKIKDDFRGLNEFFERVNLKELPGEEVYAHILEWEKMPDNRVVDYWGNLLLDGYSFAYLATLHGQLFVNYFKDAVEEKMSSHNQSLELQLLKYSSGYFSSGYFIRFENKAEVHTVYDEVELNKLFKKLGYSVKYKESGADEFSFIVSWNDKKL